MSVILPQIEDLDDKSFDVMAASKLQRGETVDPYPLIHKLHAEGPIHPGSYRALFEGMPDVFARMGFTQFMVFSVSSRNCVLVSSTAGAGCDAPDGIDHHPGIQV